MELTGGEIVVNCLERAGVEYVFGMCGHTNLAMLDPLYGSRIKYISLRHEQVAAHAADGYFRTTHKPGILMLHNGPGITNALTGIGDAAADCSAVIAIAGDVPSHHFGKDAFQEISISSDAGQYDIYKPLTKRAWRVNDIKRLPDVIKRAFHIATRGRPGPVFVSIPMDILSRKEDLRLPEKAEFLMSGTRIRGDAGEIQKAAELLVEAERGVIHAGGGVILSDASKEVTELAEYLGIPVTTTMSGQGAINENHPLSVGTTGRAGTRPGNEISRTADITLALGTRFPEQESSSWVLGHTFSIPPTKLIQVDIDPHEIGKIFPVEVAIQGDIKAVLVDLVEATRNLCSKRDWLNSSRYAEIQRNKKAWFRDIESYQDSTSQPIRPEFLLKQIRQILPEDGVITGDVGWSKNGVSQQFQVYNPRTVLMATGFGTMGFAAASVLGAKLGLPDKPVVALTGDGGFTSVASAVISAVENEIPAVWVVFNNGCYGAIRSLQKQHFGGRLVGSEFVKRLEGCLYNLDFADLARSCGAGGVTVERPEDIAPALRTALDSGKPYVVDVKVSTDAVVVTNGYWDIHDLYDGKLMK